MTMNMDIELSPELRRFVDESVQAGHFASASELISAALEYLKGSESPFPSDPSHLADLKQKVARGVLQANAGQFVEFDAETIKTEVRGKKADANPSN